MRVIYDKEADAAYIYLADSIEQGASTRQVPVAHRRGALHPVVILDVDAQDRLLGIEILNVSTTLRPNSVDALKNPGV